jgi:salicylate hydroxylase
MRIRRLTLVSGADGIRSNVRSFVLASPQSPQPTGESAYRFLVPVKDIASAKHPLAKDGVVAHNLMMIKGPDTRVIAYPVRGGELMNFVCVFRASVLRHCGCALG